MYDLRFSLTAVTMMPLQQVQQHPKRREPSVRCGLLNNKPHRRTAPLAAHPEQRL